MFIYTNFLFINCIKMGLIEWLSRVANNVIEKGKEIVSPANKKFNEIFKGIFGKNSATHPEERSLALKKKVGFHDPWKHFIIQI